MFARYGISQNESNNFLDCLTDLVVKIRQQKWSDYVELFILLYRMPTTRVIIVWWRTAFNTKIPMISESSPNSPTDTALSPQEDPTTSTPSSKVNSAPSSPSSRPPSEAPVSSAEPPPAIKKDYSSPTTPPTTNSDTSGTPSPNLWKLSEWKKNSQLSETASVATTTWHLFTPTSTKKPNR